MENKTPETVLKLKLYIKYSQQNDVTLANDFCSIYNLASNAADTQKLA